MTPESVRLAFESSDWKWEVVRNENLCDKFDYKIPIMGLTVCNSHKIYIDKRPESQSAILHEIGHWASRYYNGGMRDIDVKKYIIIK